jgi:L-2-hydroxyglutarate oxidase LhgO
METIDACVIGAGVVGLAVGRALALRGLDTIVLERADAIGTVTSARNSEVIHAGIYYASGSLKARLCVAGRQQLYAHCESHGVPHRRCGKLIVASGAGQAQELRRIEAQARANGVLDLQWLTAAEVRALEPSLQAEAALLSPSTGIIDSHALMLSLQGELESHGGALALCSPVLSLASGSGPGSHPHVLQVGGDSPMEIAASTVVNAAGLWAPGLAHHHQGLDPSRLPAARYAKGSYYALSGRSPFSRLVYPVPERGGLGVHLTLDLAGQARFGPDVEWIEPASPDDIDYRVDPARAEAFYAAIRRYWPALADDALQPAYSGVRPKLCLAGEAHEAASHDFIIEGAEAHGLPGLVNLFGIESPGLTSCLALADEVLRRLGHQVEA